MFPLILAVLAMEDGDVVVRLQRREAQALAELYDRYGGMIYRLVLRIVRDTGIAEDLVQETFLRAWNRAWRVRFPTRSGRSLAAGHRPQSRARLSSRTVAPRREHDGAE